MWSALSSESKLGLASSLFLLFVAIAGCLSQPAPADAEEDRPKDYDGPEISESAQPANEVPGKKTSPPPQSLHLTSCEIAWAIVPMYGPAAPRAPPAEWGGDRPAYATLNHYLLDCKRLGLGHEEFIDARLLIEGDDNFVASRNCTHEQPLLVRRIVAGAPDLAAALNRVAQWNATAGTIDIERDQQAGNVLVEFAATGGTGETFRMQVHYADEVTRKQAWDVDLIWVNASGVVRLVGDGEEEISFLDAPLAMVQYTSEDAMGAFAPSPVPVVAAVARDYSADMTITYFEDHACRVPR